jgi:predicted nucleic acid-binding protein
LHIACAIYANASYFITTDKRLYNKPIDGVKIVGPVNFLDSTIRNGKEICMTAYLWKN